MKLAVAGKGGAGKTTFSATASRLLARAGHQVLAIDADTNPNLHAALGISTEAVQRVPFPPTTLVSRAFDGPSFNEPIDDVLDRHSIAADDGVRLLRMGMPEHADEGCLCSAHAVVSALLTDLDTKADTITMLDMEASPEHLSRGTAREANTLLLVAEPYFRSLEAAKLQAKLARETAIGRVAVLANKCRTETDVEAIAEFCANHELSLIGSVPWGDEVLDADAASTPLLDFAPDSAVVAAIQQVCSALVPGPGSATISPLRSFDHEAGPLMCVGIPARVVEILSDERKMAVVEVEGVRREVSIVVIADEGVAVGNWVLLHVGFAMSIIDEEEAEAQLKFMRMLGSVYEEEVEAFSTEIPTAGPAQTDRSAERNEP